MRKYSKEHLDTADSEIISYLSQGLTYHQAAKNVAEHLPISIISLRYRAYQVALREGYFTPRLLQHKISTSHGSLLSKCKKKLEADGYATISEQNEIRKFVESKGSKGNPDLIAFKGNEVLLVEIIERIKGSATFVDQLQRYSKIGKAIVLLPINTKNIDLWGEQDLMT